MEDYIKIEEYINNNANDANGIISLRKKSPLAGLITLVCGIAVLLLSLKATMGDTAKMSLLTIGILAILTGFFMAILTLTAGKSKLTYKPTNAPMKHYKRYINADDRQALRECINSGDLKALGKVRIENSTCSLLHVYLSTDGQYALMQLTEYIPHSFVPVTHVAAFDAEQARLVQEFLK